MTAAKAALGATEAVDAASREYEAECARVERRYAERAGVDHRPSDGPYQPAPLFFANEARKVLCMLNVEHGEQIELAHRYVVLAIEAMTKGEAA